MRNNPIGLANTLRVVGPGTQPSIHEMLPNISIPVLCIAGEYDHKFTSIARKMCNELQNGRLEIIRGAGHATHLERPLEFNRVVLDFLNESLD
jgi:2-succinyl-6-hydroxy-2,4-cyclohexadiene-1-carboxylate synthase